MSITYFDLRKPSKKNRETKNALTYTLVELEHVSVNGNKSYMSYVDIDGIEKIANGGFTKNSDGSYVLNRTEIDKYDIYETVSYTYKDVDTHFAYVDTDGNKRTFNRPDSLVFDEETSTYCGEVGMTEYIEEEVELFEKN